MKNSILLVYFLFLVFASASCKEDDTMTVNVRFNEQAGYAPQELSSWAHAMFIFDNHSCTGLEMAPDQVSLKGMSIEAGNRATVIAYESDKNLNFGKVGSGSASTDYYVSLKDINGDIPQIWMQHTPLNEATNGFAMKPLTSVITVNLLNAPETFEQISFSLPGMTDVLYLSSGKVEALNTIQDKQITIKSGESGIKKAVFPMLKTDGSWVLAYKLKLQDTTLEGTLEVSKGIKAGQTLELNVDFSKYLSESLYTLAYRYTAYHADLWTEQKEEFFRLWPGDDTFKDKNKYYNVYVLQDKRWKSVDVRNTLCSDGPRHHAEIWNDWDNSKMLRDTMCYANFIDEFNGPVKIRVEKRTGGKFSSFQVRPSSYGIQPVECAKNTIEFTLPDWESRKVSVEFDGDRYHNLFLFPNRPDTNKPDVTASNVKYYGPGEHHTGSITLLENETLYIDEGATLYAEKLFVRGNNVTITGRGILSGEKNRHWGEDYANGDILMSVQGQGVGLKNFTLSGITIIDSPSWAVAIWNTDNVTIDNINLICWILNGDGIDLCSVAGATVKDSFIRTYDDCITLKVRFNNDPETDTKDVLIQKCIIWCDYARGIIIGPECGDWTWGTGGISNCLIEDCIVLEQSNGDGDFRAALSAVQQEQHGGGAAPMRNITFRNILIDDIQPTGRPICVEQTQQKNGCTMEDILFQNITIIDKSGCRYKSTVITNNSWISRLTFDNITYNGAKIMGEGDHLQIQGNAEVFYK